MTDLAQMAFDTGAAINRAKAAAVAVSPPEPAPTDAVGLIARMAADPECDPAKLRELLAVRREWEADEARKAFSAAVAEFQRRCPIVPKLDTADGKPYARMDRIWRTIRPLMDECRLAVTWERTTIEAEICHLAGHLRHADGHAAPLEYMLPIPKAILTRDGRAVQNAAQVMGSATSYARRYATCCALGVQVGEDDDASGGGAATITEAQVAQLRRAAQACGYSEAALCKRAKCATLEDFPADLYREAMRGLSAEADKRSAT